MSSINFEECLYFASARLNRIVGKVSDSRFKQYGLSSTAAFILIALSQEDSLNPTQIAQQLSLDRSTITRFLDKLERDGYIVRQANGRQMDVQLTAQGLKLQPDLKREWAALNQAYLDQLGPDFEERLRQSMNDAFEKYQTQNK